MFNFDKENFYLTKNSSDLSVGFSYGATLISTSAIIGFGGLAGWLGYSVFLLPIVMMITIYLATIYIGPKVYELNKKINAKTFIELISTHYKSPALRRILSIFTVIMIPFYCTAVMIGVGKYIESTIGLNYVLSLTVFSLIVFATIFYGGMKSVIRNDAIQAVMLLFGSSVIFLYTLFNYIIPMEYVDTLTLSFQASETKMIGFSKSIGFTGFTDFPDFWSKGWLFEVTLLCLTIPVGLVALPQLQTRFMLAKDENSFKKIAPYGMIIPFVIIGSFFTAGITANAYYFTEYSQTAVQFAGSIDKIIPVWINDGYPAWIGIILFLTILAAAFTTLNSLMHLLSTTVSNDLLIEENKTYGILSMIGVIIFAILMCIAFQNQPAFISRSTAVYFSLLGGSLLPSLIAMIRGHVDANASVWSFITGALASLFWLLFVHFKESKLFTGITIDIGRYNFVETIVPALIISTIVYLVLRKKDDRQSSTM
jgi:SSS family solute:Na+ symporter